MKGKGATCRAGDGGKMFPQPAEAQVSEKVGEEGGLCKFEKQRVRESFVPGQRPE